MPELIRIGHVAKMLGVSIDTLRRWDTTHRLSSIRSGVHGHRYYRGSDIDLFLKNDQTVAKQWAAAPTGVAPESDVYCQTRDVFQARLERLQSMFGQATSLETVSLVSAVAGEIGNNSFDHNLGNWPDIPGIYFSYDVKNRTIVLADRGQGIFATLKRVRPALADAHAALTVAFTETISGRQPEARGNGLKFVRSVIVAHPFTLYFQTGDASLSLQQGDNDIVVTQAEIPMRGCFATIGFEGSV